MNKEAKTIDAVPLPRSQKRSPRGKVFAKDDPIIGLVGISRSGLGDISENKHKYLAEAYKNKGK